MPSVCIRAEIQTNRLHGSERSSFAKNVDVDRTIRFSHNAASLRAGTPLPAYRTKTGQRELEITGRRIEETDLIRSLLLGWKHDSKSRDIDDVSIRLRDWRFQVASIANGPQLSQRRGPNGPNARIS